jgi:hypothetical protein
MTLLSTDIFLYSFLKPEDGSDMFLRNVDWLSAVYTPYIPEDRILEEISLVAWDELTEDF